MYVCVRHVVPMCLCRAEPAYLPAILGQIWGAEGWPPPQVVITDMLGLSESSVSSNSVWTPDTSIGELTTTDNVNPS